MKYFSTSIWISGLNYQPAQNTGGLTLYPDLSVLGVLVKPL
jgi:hypothetical protein